jgi:hypothetical protein
VVLLVVIKILIRTRMPRLFVNKTSREILACESGADFHPMLPSMLVRAFMGFVKAQCGRRRPNFQAVPLRLTVVAKREDLVRISVLAIGTSSAVASTLSQ